MRQTIYLCKVKLHNGSINYLYLDNKTPKKYLKDIAKIKKFHKKNNFEENNEYLVKEILDCESKTFDVITISIETSDEIKKIRDRIENKSYNYGNIEYIRGVDKRPSSVHLFNVTDSLPTILEQIEDHDEIERIKDFINNTGDLCILKRVVGKYLFWFYTFNPKTIKYSNIIEKIKVDFSSHYKKDKFFVFKKVKDYSAYNRYGEREFISLDKIKSDCFLNIHSLKLKNQDTIWLKMKLKINVDKEKLSNDEYINDIQAIYNLEDKKTIESKYLDFTRCVKENAFLENSGDEVVLMPVVEKETLIKSRDDYYEKIYKKYGRNIEDIYIHIDKKELNDYKEDEDEELNENAELQHIIKRGDKILFEEILLRKDVPSWAEIWFRSSEDEE